MRTSQEPRYYGIIAGIIVLLVISTAFFISTVVDELKIRNECVKVIGQIDRIQERDNGNKTYSVKLAADSASAETVTLILDSSAEVGEVNDYALIHYDPKSGWAKFVADSGYDFKFKMLVVIMILLIVFLVAGIQNPEWLLSDSKEIFHTS